MRRGIGYVVHYKKNIEELDAKVHNLKDVRGMIQVNVHAARNNGEVIENEVLNWLTDVNKKEEGVNRLLVDRENINSCFDVCSRYQLGKEGKKLLSDVSGLIDRCGNFYTVGHRAPLDKIWYTPTTNFEQFESRDSVRKNIIKALENDMIYKIGIHGMTGTGKTRMAEEIAKQAVTEKLFDEVAKVVFSENPDLKKIQVELADCLNLSFRTKSEVERKEELCNRLTNGKKILVIIDDIWNDEIKLEAIGIPSSYNQIKGCKVLLTSREEDVCIRMGVQENFPIGLLQKHEAWCLFKKIFGDFIEFTSGIYFLAKRVCGECDRLPLTILVVARTLRDQKEKHPWNDVLVQLRKYRGDNIEEVTKKLYFCIEWSYKCLNQPDVRSCFLHCSLFPKYTKISIDDLVLYGVAMRFLEDSWDTMERARDRTRVLVDSLKKSHLLEGKSQDFVVMHDIIQDVAISKIASKEGFLAKTGVPKWPEKDDYQTHRVISLRSKNICELPRELECSELRTLLLECDADRKPQIPDSFFKGTEKLEVLNLQHVRLPSSPLNLVHLRMLRLYSCEQVNLAFLKELRNLEILCIADSNLKEVSMEVGQLTSIRWLDLRSCAKLEIIPSGVIKSLSNIEELYIPHDFGGWGDEGNAGLDELNSLTRLTTLQIHIRDGMVLLPNELCFELLNRFKISIGRTSGFDYYEENLGGARMLKLDDITLRKEFNILMEKAEVLILKRVEGVKNVLHCGDGKEFSDLKYLKIEDCSDMEHLLGRLKWTLQSRGSFSKLSVLIVKNCTLKFLFFPSMVRGLPQLQELEISQCEIMEEIILDDEEVMDKVIFLQLKKMKLRSLPILRSIYRDTKKTSTTECSTFALAQALFNEKVSFPALEELQISELDSVTRIWDNQLFVGPEAEKESFQRLRRMKIDRCKKLENVIPSNLIPRLQNLETLIIRWCDLVVSAVDVLTTAPTMVLTTPPTMELPRLQKMSLYRLPKLMLMGLNAKEHSDHRLIGAYSNLTSLSIDRCDRLRNVFSSSITRNLRQLQDLTVRYCEEMEEIIAVEKRQEEEEVMDDGIIVFPELKKMELRLLPKLKSFCSKKEAVEDDILQVQSLFNHKVKFTSLEEFIYVGSKNNVKEIWNNTVPTDSFCKLRRMVVYRCEKLLSVAPSKLLGSFQNLEELCISTCPSLEGIFKVEGGSKIAEERKVARDKDIEKKLEIISELPSLVKVEIKGCPKLKSAAFYHSKEKVVFPILEDLTLSNGSIFEDIWYGHVRAGSFSKVRKLRVESCSMLVNVSTLLQRFEVVEELSVHNCSSLEVVFNLEGLEDIERGATVSSPIKKLKLTDLPKLVHIGKMDLQGLSFHNLTSLTVIRCHNLKYLFSFSMAKNLTKIEHLWVEYCDAIEEIIRNENQGEEDGTMDEIVFPNLRYIQLEGLANLTSFCSANNAFKLPSLRQVFLFGSPKMKTFTSGRISTPMIYRVSDLNNYVQQEVQERKGYGISIID